MTKDEVSAVIGKPAAESPSVNTATDCDWQHTVGTLNEKSIALLRLLETRPDAAQNVAAYAARGCAPTTPQVGDRSCLYAASPGKYSASLLFAKGNKLFSLGCETATDAALVTWAQAVAGRA